MLPFRARLSATSDERPCRWRVAINVELRLRAFRWRRNCGYEDEQRLRKVATSWAALRWAICWP